MTCWCCALTPTAWATSSTSSLRRESTASMPLVALDKRYFGMIDDFETRIAAGPPSLREAQRLVVEGDVQLRRRRRRAR